MRADPTEALLPHYLAELAYLREAGAAFARRHPQVAARLELDPTGSADPHVERLIESFAFLTARLRRLHDAQSPEIARSLLEVLQPSLVQPVPSMAIAEFTVDPRQARSANGITVPAGTMLFAPASDGAVVRLRTAYPVPLWPLRLAEAELLAPGALDDGAAMPALAATLRLRLACLGGRRLAELALPSLRIFLHGPRGTGAALHELLAHRLLGVLVAEPGTGRVLRRLPAGAVRPLGLESHEALLPQPAHAHDGYRLLQEYFAFPEKFLFVELTGLGPGGLGDGEAVDLLFLLSRPPPDALALDAGCFRLGCTPVVNLFRKTSEPIRLDLARLEHPLEADAREARACEIHSIEAVTATAPGGASRPVRPFFSCTHEEIETAGTAFWTARREPTARPDGRGSDVLIAFVDQALVPARPPGEALFADLLCTNRGLAERMPAGARLTCELDAPVASVACLTRPTPQQPAALGGPELWQLVSQLALNRLSLADAGGLDALREILRLHGGTRAAETAAQLAGLVGLRTRPVVRRLGDDAWRGFCRGLEVTLTVDESRFTGASPWLLGAILSRFLGLYAAANSFTQLVLESQRHGRIAWPPQTGAAPLL